MTQEALALRATTRRHFFNDCGVGVAKIALSSLRAGRKSGDPPIVIEG